jgi:hypothetical protein
MGSSPTNVSINPVDQGKGQKNGNKSGSKLAVPIWIAISGLLILGWLLSWTSRIGDGWIHLLPVVAVIILVALAISSMPARNIEAEQSEIPKWNAAQPAESLAQIHSYVIREAGKSLEWYWRSKRSKAFFSQLIRFSAWGFAAIGGLLPVIGSLFPNALPTKHDPTNGLWASLLLGIAAALLGLDKAFGYSSGWARYVLAATNIHKTLEEFRMDWAELMAKAGAALTIESVTPLIDRATKFRHDVEALVLQETKDWVTEFQNSMVQMEKDVAAQVAALKTQVDKTIQARAAAEQPGAIQLQIQNAAKADPGTTISVFLTDAKDVTTQEKATGSTWTRLNILPGQYKIKIQATVKGQSAEDQKVALVEPGKITDVQLTL